MEKSELLQKVDGILQDQEEYQEYLTHLGPDLGNKDDPLDELIYVHLSNPIRGRDVMLEQAWKAYDDLREAFPDWKQVLDAEVDAVAESIRKAVGDEKTARDKAVGIQKILKEVRSKLGVKDLNLGFPSDMDDHTVEERLMEVDGVGPKIAHCVMLFSLDRHVLPVDRHVHRILERLSLVSPGSNQESASEEIREFVPEGSARSLHVDFFKHGRLRCTKHNPKCDRCVIETLCAYAGYHVLDPKSRYR